jgi:hypothetical protein
MMTFDEGRTRMPGNNGFSTMPVRPGMAFDTETMPVRPGMTFGTETMPDKQNTDPGFDFLRSFIGQDQARTQSFDVTPDIDSPVIDEDIRKLNRNFGSQTPTVRRNMERMKMYGPNRNSLLI